MSFTKHSLKVRIAATTLLVVLLGSWLLTFYVRRELTRDMERLLSEQQFTMASLLADDVGLHFTSLRDQLQGVAHAAETSMHGGNKAMQRFIDERPLLQSLFNGGFVAIGPDGTVLAEHPESLRRIGVNYLDYPVVRAALKDGRAAIAPPRVGKHSGQPVVWVVAPVRSFDGQVIGALAGILNLGLPSFLSHVTESKYGRTGGFLIIDVESRTVVAASDKKRVLEKLPPPGRSPVIDRFLSGHDGSAVFVNPLGVEILASDVNIPAANWVLAATMPTEEAFAPIRDLVTRMLLATAVLTLVVALVLWWLLRRQLAPFEDNLERMSAMAEPGQALVKLPVERNDEIGRLVGVFNHLVEAINIREGSLRASDASLRNILAASLDGYWKVGALGQLLEVNGRYAELSGYSEAELIGMHVSDLDIHHDPAAAAQHLQRIVDIGSDLFETEHRRKDGSIWQVEVSAIYSSVDGGQVVSFLRDISARKKFEQDIQTAERRYRALVEQSLVGVYFIQDGRFVYVNPRFTEIFGYANAEEVVRTLTVNDLVAPQDRGLVAESLRRRTSGEEKSLSYGFKGLRKDGTLVDVEVFGSAAEIDGRPAVIGVIVDVTERKAAEAVLHNYQETLEATVLERTRELAQAKDRAESGSRAKSAFLARMSHELRTPLNHIVGFSLLLKKDMTEPRLRERLENILGASQSLLKLIDDILDYSRTEGDELVIEEVDFDLPELLARVASDAFAEATAKGVDLVVDIDSELPGRVRGDRARIQQILGHLVGNAVKFSEHGTIQLRARIGEDKRHVLRFEVEDQGVGIALDRQAGLFLLFDQGDGSTTRRFGGAGLGLALSKRLVDLMAGAIGCRSVEGQGSLFWFEVPLVSANAPGVDVLADASRGAAPREGEERRELLRRMLVLLSCADLECVRLWHDEYATFAALFGERVAAVDEALANFDFDRVRELFGALGEVDGASVV